MRYTDPATQSAEYLRLIIPLMARHETPANPVSYALWYHYVCGANAELNKDIDALVEKNRVLSTEQVEALFSKHISECDEDTVRQVQADMRRILGDISSSAAQTGDEASRFDEVLEGYGHRLDAELAAEEIRQIVDGLSHDTRQMRDSVSVLNDQLAESRREVDTLRSELKRVKEQAFTDPLTGLVNRRGLSQALTAALAAGEGPRAYPCLMMLDIDHFKRINDTYGHLLGDKVIQFIGKTLKTAVKGRDTAARYGGEEFAVLLPETELKGARAVAEDIRTTIERARIRRMDRKESIGVITVSIGVARYRTGETHSDLIGLADAALYRSKEAGRNRVTMEDPD